MWKRHLPTLSEDRLWKISAPYINMIYHIIWLMWWSMNCDLKIYTYCWNPVAIIAIFLHDVTMAEKEKYYAHMDMIHRKLFKVDQIWNLSVFCFPRMVFCQFFRLHVEVLPPWDAHVESCRISMMSKSTLFTVVYVSSSVSLLVSRRMLWDSFEDPPAATTCSQDSEYEAHPQLFSIISDYDSFIHSQSLKQAASIHWYVHDQ